MVVAATRDADGLAHAVLGTALHDHAGYAQDAVTMVAHTP